jgi:putative DNA primase/helicase
LNDRAQDNWEPLFAIAEIASGEWPRLARTAALKLSSDDKQFQSTSVELLADIEEIFQSKNLNRIFSVELIKALCADEEKPWATYNRGSSITARQIANRLREFKISSKTVRIGANNAKGYMKSEFEDAFARYLTVSATVDVTASQVNLHENLNVTDTPFVTDEKVTCED